MKTFKIESPPEQTGPFHEIEIEYEGELTCHHLVEELAGLYKHKIRAGAEHGKAFDATINIYMDGIEHPIAEHIITNSRDNPGEPEYGMAGLTGIDTPVKSAACTSKILENVSFTNIDVIIEANGSAKKAGFYARLKKVYENYGEGWCDLDIIHPEDGSDSPDLFMEWLEKIAAYEVIPRPLSENLSNAYDFLTDMRNRDKFENLKYKMTSLSGNGHYKPIWVILDYTYLYWNTENTFELLSEYAMYNEAFYKSITAAMNRYLGTIP